MDPSQTSLWESARFADILVCKRCRLTHNQMRGRISSLSTLCKRFAAILRRCDPHSFLDIGRIYPEIAPMEKRIDMHIELLRRDEFREMECVSDVAKYVFNLVGVIVLTSNPHHTGSTHSSSIWERRSSTISSTIWANASLVTRSRSIMTWTCSLRLSALPRHRSHQLSRTRVSG